MPPIYLIPVSEFTRVGQAPLADYERVELLADMCRANTLAMVKRAGSGHLGTSFSAMDIVAWLYFKEMNLTQVGWQNPQRDIYFSSKGHDVPGLYATLFALGVIPRERFIRLRRLGGLDGHPDVGVPGIEVNSGSLGMGLSQGRGFAWAKRYAGHAGRVYVLTGDGELQEGQNYEALQATLHQGLTQLTMIVDHNKVQSDKLVTEIVALGDLEAKFRAFGWYVTRCDGHNLRQFEQALADCRQVTDRPQVIIADTLKGRGVSFMEHPRVLRDGQGYYKWHAGAPDDAAFETAYAEITTRIQQQLQRIGLSALLTEEVEPVETIVPRNALGEPVSVGAQTKLKAGAEYVAEAYGQTLVELGKRHAHLVVLDADLAADCRTRAFELAFPERFIQNGIAEQDMVSMAGGLARAGLLPVVNSFASFLTARANEQIYTNASEQTRIIYACHYAGLIPAGPGKSHQSLRDISLLSALPNLVIVQPATPEETRQALTWCVETAHESCALRLVIGPSPRPIVLPSGYQLTYGRGVKLTTGTHALLFAYGPVMLAEALIAAELLATRGREVAVVNLPWLNRIDADWLAETVAPYEHLYVVDDHALTGGLGTHLLTSLATHNLLTGRSLVQLGIEGWPACGTPAEVLQFHGLDGAGLAKRMAG